MFLRFKTILAGCALLSAQLAFAQSTAPNPLHPALERADRKARIEKMYPTQFAFEMTYRDNDVHAHAFFDPGKDSGARLDVLRPTPSEWSNDFKEMLREFDANPYEEFWCTDFLELVGPDVHPVMQDGNHITFAFTPHPGPDDDSDDRKFLSEMIAHLTVDQTSGAIQKFEMRNRRPFKPMFIAKIKSFQMQAQCKIAPDGRYYVSDLTTDLSAKIALKKVEEHEQRRIYNLTSPR